MQPTPHGLTGLTGVLEPGAITLAATPIGNPLDASLRLVAALQEADLIAAEDTRRLKRLATDLGVRLSANTTAYHEHNESERTPLLLDAARKGQKVLVVTDAGMPVVSDPGYRAVVAAHRENIPLRVFPGPSAPLTALVHSGLPPENFAFEGFLPKTRGKLETALLSRAQDKRTLIFFESPRRLATTLEVMASVFGNDREACVARELTKTYEENKRASLGELAKWAADTEILGEIVVVVGPWKSSQNAVDLVSEVQSRAAAGERLKDAAKAVAREHEGVKASELYNLVLSKS